MSSILLINKMHKKNSEQIHMQTKIVKDSNTINESIKKIIQKDIINDT
jgi:uncharacterized membrane-anchored protein